VTFFWIKNLEGVSCIKKHVFGDGSTIVLKYLRIGYKCNHMLAFVTFATFFSVSGEGSDSDDDF